MKNIKVIYLSIGIAVLVTGLALDLSFDIMVVVSAALLICLEVILYRQLKIAEHNAYKTFTLRTAEWMWRPVSIAFVLLALVRNEISVLNVLAMVLALALAVVIVLKNLKHVYGYSAIGIENLSTGEKLEFEKVTSIRWDEEHLVIDTSDERNALVIRRAKVDTPDWDQLTAGFAELKSLIKANGI